LRQIEAIRAVVLRGSIRGAAEHLHVSAPGISRIIKHTEESLGIRLFERKGGTFVPAVEARNFFDQLSEVYKGVENLQLALESVKRGEDSELAFASAPSIATYIAPQAIKALRDSYPGLYIDLNIVKYEEAINYVLLEQGEFAIMTTDVDSQGIEVKYLGKVPVKVIVPLSHPLADRDVISVQDLSKEAVIGVDPQDPFGAQLYAPFKDAGLDVTYATRGRFSQTVIGLVRENQGVALIDETSVLNRGFSGVSVKDLSKEYFVSVFLYSKAGHKMSGFAQQVISEITKRLSVVE
jgi:DNA-binding transcriptional LysR family regulator